MDIFSKLAREAKEKWLAHFINQRLDRLADTETEDEFYQVFDEIMAELLPRAGESVEAVRNVRGAFQRRHPMTKIAMLLLQDRLSKRTREKLAENFFIKWIIDVGKRNRLKEEHFKAPWFFVISPTYACNLNCYGCYAHEYKRGEGMSFETFDRILREADASGIRFLTISGGEPFFWRDKETDRDLLDMAEKHSNMFFQVYTNGTLLDEKTVDRLARLGNVAPAISQEGFEKETDARRGKGTWEKIRRARKLLYEAGVLQGFSITATKQNTDVITSDEFVDSLIEQNLSFGWYFTYIPIGKEPAIELMQTPEQREHMRKKIWEWRSTKPIFIGDFWNDGPWVGGCIAAGRRYFHINALGDIEPCVFAHFAVDNIYKLWKEGKGLRDAITSKFFQSIRKAQQERDNWLTPCCIIDEPSNLRDAVRDNNAYPTHHGAETILQGKIAQHLDNYSKEMRKLTWKDFQRMEKGDYDTPVVKLSKVIENQKKKNETEYKLIFNKNDKE